VATAADQEFSTNIQRSWKRFAFVPARAETGVWPKGQDPAGSAVIMRGRGRAVVLRATQVVLEEKGAADLVGRALRGRGRLAVRLR